MAAGTRIRRMRVSAHRRAYMLTTDEVRLGKSVARDRTYGIHGSYGLLAG